MTGDRRVVLRTGDTAILVDVVTLNSNLKRNALPGVRARSYGIARQWIDQIIEVHTWNCVAHALWRQRTQMARAA